MKFAISFLIGAIVGAVLALLFAPASGDELRKNIKTQADTKYASLQEEIQKGKQEMQSRINQVSEELKARKSGAESSGSVVE